MPIRVLYHDNCFDGASSAALFTAFYRQCIDAQSTFEYVGMNHGPGDVFGANAFREDPAYSHVCVDFRYSPDARLTWWFDHHQSAFVSTEDENHFYNSRNPQHFYDPTARSCTKFLAESCKKVYNFNDSSFAELIYWADVIDGAKFDSPQMAVELKEPALKLMMWVEANHHVPAKIRFIEDLRTKSLLDIVQSDYVKPALTPLMQDHERNLLLMKERLQQNQGVVFFDITNDKIRAPNKFIPYYFYPDCHYVVGVSRAAGKAKISVGSNPWYAHRRTVNIASLCARHGGGGHPVVGAVSLPESQLAKAKQLAQEIVLELQSAVAHEQSIAASM